MAVVDIAGFVADLKDHAVEHGFHVHDERHFVESYSLRQTWEVDLHPEEGCEGPVDLYLSLVVDPRVLLGFEDAVIGLPDEQEPDDTYYFPLDFTWALPPCSSSRPSLPASAGPISPWKYRQPTRSRRRPTRPSAHCGSLRTSRSRSCVSARVKRSRARCSTGASE
jgi:hypothetical protein